MEHENSAIPRDKKIDCPLCQAEKLSEWFFEDEVCYICTCITCHRIMVVYRYHGEPTHQELDHIKEVSKKLFPSKKFRGFRRQIFDHFHENLI